MFIVMNHRQKANKLPADSRPPGQPTTTIARTAMPSFPDADGATLCGHARCVREAPNCHLGNQRPEKSWLEPVHLTAATASSCCRPPLLFVVGLLVAFALGRFQRQDSILPAVGRGEGSHAGRRETAHG